ncbi:uncharacterized protein LOC116259299 [Nymphaea colorata]|nr:uncharacterized protein LOC116259299 [Nymphaea colorata]
MVGGRGVMNLVRYSHFIRNVQNPTVIVSFWGRLQSSFTTTINHDKDPSSSASFDDYPSSELVGYLVSSCGLPSEAAAGICRKLGSRASVQKARMIIDFLKESGVSDVHVRKAITISPILLSSELEKTVKPKVRAFLDWGFSARDVGQIISMNYRILRSSLEKKIMPVVSELRAFLPNDKRAFVSMKNFFFCSLLGHDVEKSIGTNLSALRRLGVADRSLSTLLIHWPMLLGRKPCALEKMVERVKELGIDKDSLMFPYALFTVSTMTKPVWDAKVDVLKGAGWTQENILLAFNKYPLFMTISASNLKKKLEYFDQELGFKPSRLAANPTRLLFSIEKRVTPRLAVRKILISKKDSWWMKFVVVILVHPTSWDELGEKDQSFGAISSGLHIGLLVSFWHQLRIWAHMQLLERCCGVNPCG